MLDPEITSAIEAIEFAKQSLNLAENHLEWLRSQCEHEEGEWEDQGYTYCKCCVKCGQMLVRSS